MADVNELALNLQIKINSDLLQRLEGLENLVEASKRLLFFREGILAKEYDKLSPTLAGALHDLSMAVKAAEYSQTAMCQCMEIDFENLKSIIKEIEEAKKGGDGWEAWSALCLWLAQYEHAQQTVQLRCPDTGLDVHECGCSVCAVMSPTNR